MRGQRAFAVGCAWRGRAAHARLRRCAAFAPREEARTRSREERHVQWEPRRRRGLCGFTTHYVGRPTTRVVDEAYSETVYELQPDQIKARCPDPNHTPNQKVMFELQPGLVRARARPPRARGRRPAPGWAQTGSLYLAMHRTPGRSAALLSHSARPCPGRGLGGLSESTQGGSSAIVLLPVCTSGSPPSRAGSLTVAGAQEYFMRLVETTVATSVAHVRDFVRRYLEQRLADARGRIGAYGSRYANAMLAALDTSRSGAPAVLARRVWGLGTCKLQSLLALVSS